MVRNLVSYMLQDTWIPEFSKGSFTPLISLPVDTKVCFLMDEIKIAWDPHKSSFPCGSGQDTIAQILLSRHGVEDFVAWSHDKSGIYYVHSAYNLARTEIFYTKTTTTGLLIMHWKRRIGRHSGQFRHPKK
jgi:hypothetical protein